MNRESSIEIWKPVIGYEERYEISNKGNLKSMKLSKILKPYCNKGYLFVMLSKDNKTKTTYI